MSTLRWRLHLIGLLLAMLLAVSSARAQISLVGATTAIDSDSSIAVATPAGLVAGDVMVAVVASRDWAFVWGTPSGWQLANITWDFWTGLVVTTYTKTYAASEAASHSFGLLWGARAAATIVGFRGVDTATPFAATSGAVGGSSTLVSTGSANVPVANAMVIGVFAQTNGNNDYTPPAGMAEAVDFGTKAGPNGVTLGVAYGLQVAAGSSGVKTATSSGRAVGAGVMLAMRPGASTGTVSPSGFNAFDTGTAAGAISGVLTTRVAGAASTVDVIVLNNAGTGLHAGFTGSVSLSWVDARDNSGALSGSCRSSWVNVGAAGAAGTAAFSNASRTTVSITPPAAGTRVMRLRLSATVSGSVITACSNDAFAVIPASYTLTATDADASTAGTTRTLANTAASGGHVHRAGRPFTLSAQAVSATGALMTAYDGTPTVASNGCLLPAGCSAGALTAPSVAAVGGVYTNHGMSYAEVGAVAIKMSDATYAAIDAADTAAAARTIDSPDLSVGRFVPDQLVLTVSKSGEFATANGGCMLAGSGATFINQAFGWAKSPEVTVTARNAAGAITSHWTGNLMKLTAAAPTPSLSASGSGSATVSASFGSFTLDDLGSGQARYTASNIDRFLLALADGVAQASVTPTWTWSLAVTDASEAAVSGNPTLAANTSQSPIDWNLGAVFHSGRLALAPGHGDARAGVRQRLELQRYTSAGWVTMTEDRGCVTVNPNNLGVEAPSGVFASVGACAAPVASAVTTAGGRAWIRMPATPGAAHGRLAIRLAGAAATGNSCSAAGAAQTLTALAMPWLLGGSSGSGPLALATWGRANRDLVLRREAW